MSRQHDSNKLIVQCGQLFAEHAKKAKPFRSTLRGPNGGIPLWVVISGAVSDVTGSRGITAIREGQYRCLGYRTYSAAVSATAERLGQRRCLTWVQVDLLKQIIAPCHRGRDHDPWHYVAAGVVGEPWFEDHCGAAKESRFMVVEALQRRKLSRPPLSALIDPRLTNLILLKQLEVILTSKRREPCPSKQTRSHPSATCAA